MFWKLQTYRNLAYVMLLVQGQGLQIKLAALGNSQGIALKMYSRHLFVFLYDVLCNSTGMSRTSRLV